MIKFFIARKQPNGTFSVVENHAYDSEADAAKNARIFFGNKRDWVVLNGTDEGIPWPCSWPSKAAKQ